VAKNRVIVEAVLAGQSHAAVARQYGVSKVWVGKLMARWRVGGMEAVARQSRRPRSNPNATSPEMIQRVTALRVGLAGQGLDAGAHTLHAHLQQLSGLEQPVPSVTTIWRILTRAGLITPQPRKRPRRSYVRFEADLPNECWQADFTHWPLADGTDTEILCFLDDHARYAISLTAHHTVTAGLVLDAFRAACTTHGIPASTLTDNGRVFTTRTTTGGPNGFERELAVLGIVQKNGRPNHPQTQGKVERFQQTLKKWLRAQPAAGDLPTLQVQLDTFTAHYNQHRPHRALAGRTPAQAYTERAKATPTGRDGHFRIRQDKTDQQGCVTLRHGGRLHHIGLGAEHRTTPVRMLIHDLHITVIHADTGEILRDLTLDPTRDYQPLGRPPGPPKGTPQRGGRKPGPK
jgi:transposase InsO family protein